MEVGVQLRSLLLVFIFTLPCTLSQVWEVPPFIDIAPRPEVEYLPYNADRGQSINMDEEIKEEVVLALFNYKGSTRPVMSFFVGSPNDLGAEIRSGEAVEGKQWYLIITKKQDFETPSHKEYAIKFIIESISVDLYLKIVNIDDNAPVIQGETCQVPELYKGLTDCTYLVTDADGELSIKSMNFFIEGRGGEENLFGFHEIRNDTSSMSMYISLITKEELDYAKSQIHIFTIVANDSASNQGRVNAVVQVIDMPNQPPIWKSIFASQRFDEKTSQFFQVEAVDGDTGINKPIMYKLVKPDNYTFFSIGKENGILNVEPIDRDTLEQEVFQFAISAYKADNESWETTSDVFIIIDDINDQLPIVLNTNFEQSIKEETFVSLEFEQSIIIHDRDLGDNAQYNVFLESVNPPDAADSFIIVPGEGYQRQEFKIIIVEANNLDYENITWQHIELRIKAVEKKNPTHIGTATVRINLINWNDELPIFEKESYSATFEEIVGKGYVVGTVLALDRDIGDTVKHSLVGSVNSYLEIDESSGKIVVSADNAFNYNRQDEVIVQVMAQDQLGDPPYHTTYAQLTIKLIDVNHQQPEIQMPQETISVEEHSLKDVTITDLIKGSDPDRKAVIQFSIDWSQSSASKPGRTIKKEEFENCVRIETVYLDEGKKGEAKGVLVVNEVNGKVLIDFEVFEVLYLTIILTDTDQTIGINTVTGKLSLIIEDINDNPPVWVPGTLQTKRIVRERSDSDIFIGSVLATDADGPLFNVVKYYLLEGENTPKGLVAIDEQMGQLTVKEPKGITCDYPNPRDNLFYVLTASDCNDYFDKEEKCFRTEGKIEIDIIDVNNQDPIISDGEFDSTVHIYENSSTGTDITKIIATDLDRDVPYRTISYSINFEGQSAELRKLFALDLTTGLLTVNLEDGEVLDRDEGDFIYEIYVSVTDNRLQEGDGQRNTNKTTITVILLDVNDNAPEFPEGLHWSISENTTMGVELEPVVVAHDKDEPDTDNSRVQYSVESLTPASNQNPVDVLPDLIGIKGPDNKTGILFTQQSLKGYWGSYLIELRAYDFGHPQLESFKTYELKIPPFNFESPKFVFPVEDETYRLKLENAYPGALYYAIQGRFDDIEATDPDGLEAGMVSFEVTEKDGASEYFTIDSQDNKMGRLVLKKTLDEKTKFEITIKATDKGTDPYPKETEITFTVMFVPTEGEPYFEDENKRDTANFTEFEAGLLQSAPLFKAIDPKNTGCTVNCAQIYYYIIKGASSEFFKLDKFENILSLEKELDRSQQQVHEIVIAATNNRDHIEAVPSIESLQNVVIQVKEANPMPRFNQSLYAGGVSLTDKIGKQMFIMMATHTENLPIKYFIDKDTMKVDSSLQGVKDMAFTLDEDTGEMTLNFSPLVSMSGMFEFDVNATDIDNKNDTAAVKVYMIADNNRVSFIFENVQTKVQEDSKFTADTFTKMFGYQCNIDYILVASDNGVALDNQTEVRSHFINNSVALDASYIAELSTDLTLMRNLRDELRKQNLYLKDFSTTKSENTGDSLEKMLQIVLIVVSSVLGTLCIVLLVAFCLRTKSLNRRLQALSETKFGSQSSGLNRTGLGATVPGTNKHALEGSNPVWNEEIKAPNFDTISNISGDSDLIGVEDNPQFAYEEPAKNNKPRRNTVYDKNKNTGPSRRPTVQNVQSSGNEHDL